MALWAHIQQLNAEVQQKVTQIYAHNFPIEVRNALSHWIEEQAWDILDPDNPAHDVYIAQIVNTLFVNLEKKLSTVEDFLSRVNLRDKATQLRVKYGKYPQYIVRVLKHCLNAEMALVQQANVFMQESSNMYMLQNHPVKEISIKLDYLRRHTGNFGEFVWCMSQSQNAFVIHYNKSSKRQDFLDQMQQTGDPNMYVKASKEKIVLDTSIRTKVQDLFRMRLKAIDNFQKTSMALSDLKNCILDTELQWKRSQQLAGNGEVFHDNLNQIQEWCAALADVIWLNRGHIMQVENLSRQVPLSIQGNATQQLTNLNNEVTGLLSFLVTSTFIIEKQPPQVLRTNTVFAAKVRLLVGSKLGINVTPPQVKVTIISEGQAIALMKNDKVLPRETSGELLNNIGTMVYDESNKELSVNFRNLQLRKIKRHEKKGTESVMDEKFALLFQSQFKVGGELTFQVWTFSLPIIVIVHGNQDPHARATITWDNAFAEPGRVPFQVPEKVCWKAIAEVLSTMFKAGTGRPLSEDNLQFLAGKVFRSSQFIEDSAMVTWSQFCKEPLPERIFSFWEWFYAIIKVTRDHLRSLWNDGLIIGFIARHQAEDILLKKCNGTFLLRFSDSVMGGITIAWVANAQQREGQEVFMVQPFTAKDFAIRPIADRIYDLKNLLVLFPKTPKDNAFGKYYTRISGDNSSNGYVKSLLVTHLPGFNHQEEEKNNI